MNKSKKKSLKEKGWDDEEIKKAERALEKEEAIDVHFSKIVFWSSLVVIIFANLVVSLVLIPFLIVLNKWFVYIIVALLAGTVGFLYNFLVMDIGHLKKHHHILAAVFIPIIALANMLMMVYVSNRFMTDLKLDSNLHNSWWVAVVFAVAFLVPYLVDKVIRWVKG